MMIMYDYAPLMGIQIWIIIIIIIIQRVNSNLSKTRSRLQSNVSRTLETCVIISIKKFLKKK